MMQGVQTWCSVTAQIEGWDTVKDGMEVKEGEDMCIPMADSC